MTEKIARFTLHEKYLWPYYLRTEVKWNLKDRISYALKLKSMSLENAKVYIYANLRIEQDDSVKHKRNIVEEEREKGLIFCFEI